MQEEPITINSSYHGTPRHDTRSVCLFSTWVASISDRVSGCAVLWRPRTETAALTHMHGKMCPIVRACCMRAEYVDSGFAMLLGRAQSVDCFVCFSREGKNEARTKACVANQLAHPSEPGSWLGQPSNPVGFVFIGPRTFSTNSKIDTPYIPPFPSLEGLAGWWGGPGMMS